MRWAIFVICLFGCKVIKKPTVQRQPARLTVTMTNAEQTAAIIKNQDDIAAIKQFVSYLDSSIFEMRGNVATFKDSIVLNIVVVKRLYVGLPDTSHGHGGNDTLIVDPNGILNNRK